MRWVEQKDPTCTDEGVKAHWECTKCGRNYYEGPLGNLHEYLDKVDRIKPLSHDYCVQVPAKDATCIEPGYTEGTKCSRCDVYKDNGHQEISPTGVHRAAEDAQWQSDETDHWKVCPDCQENVLEAAHSYDYTTGKCKDCGYVCEHDYESAAWEHDNAEHPAEGFHWRHCTICNYSSEHVSHQTANEITPVAVNGRLVWTCECGLVIQEVTCLHPEDKYVYMDNEGSATHKITCGDCGETVNEKENHHFVGGKCSFCGAEESASTDCQHPGTWIAKPTADKAKHEYYCGVCGELAMQGYTEDHTYDSETHTCICGVRDPEAGVDPSTCEHKGTRTPESCGDLTHAYRCDDCGQLIPGSLENHGYKCMDNGDGTHSWLCTVCKAEGPDYDPWQHEKHSWVEENGIEKCGKCGAVKHVDPTPECDHPGTEKTWTDNKDGKTHAVFCKKCNTTINGTENHIWENGECKYCHAKKPVCQHGMKKYTPNLENGAFTDTHTVSCFWCNEVLKSAEAHDADSWAKGECKDCHAKNPEPTTPVEPEVCKHPNVKEAIPEVPATCETDGMKAHYYCDDCQKYLTGTATHLTEVTEDSLVLKATGHKWIAVPEEEATCIKEGMQSHNKCENCGQLTKGTSYTPVTEGSLKIAKKPHTPGEAVVIKEASCKEEGTKETRCTVCNTVISTESIAKLPHTEVVDAAVPATCTTAGKTEGKHCSVCGEILAAQTEIAKLPHTYGAWTGMEGTDNHTHKCTVCGADETQGHAWDAGKVTTSATCEGAEVTTYTCTVCGDTSTKATGGALGHNAVAYATVPATCTTTGYTGGTYCSRCNAVITSRITIPALGHSYGAWTVTRAATCAAAGEETRTCARNSGHTETRTVAATGNHAWNAGVITTYPTYYSTGLRTYTCATCAATRTETIPQLTYTYDPGYTDPDPDPDPDYQPPVSSNRQPTTTIPDDNTPLGNTPNTPTVTIEDEDTPLANRPLPFIDVASGDWFRPYVSFVYGKGMMTGMSDTLFGPNVSTTRGMIVTIIYRMENASATGVSPFTDVERDEYYADPISWASDNGVVLGYSETLFGPKDNITREQMAAILYRYCVSKGIDVANYGDLSRFPDGDKVSDYAVEAMRWAVDRGLIAGMDDGRLDPTGTATRAQVATILNRFCEMIGA